MNDCPWPDDRMLLKDIAIGCPMGRAMDDCPAGDLRGISAANRIVEVDSMAPEKIEDIIVRHRKCMARRAGSS